MINDDIHKIKSGDSSTNIQANNITINQGISKADAMEIALNVYKNNFITLSDLAAKTAFERVKRFNEKFLTELFQQNEQVISEFQTPALQITLLEAQRECAKSGEKNLEEILISLLLERASTSNRSLKQIALEESIKVVPKLTESQLDILVLNYLL